VRDTLAEPGKPTGCFVAKNIYRVSTTFSEPWQHRQSTQNQQRKHPTQHI
jgi:hypothetical protein